MARKARVSFKTKDGQSVSFVAKNKVKRTVTRAKKPKAVKAASAPVAIKAKRVATPRQLQALADARAKRTNAKLARMYGGLPVGGPGIASLTDSSMTSMPSAAQVAAMNAPVGDMTSMPSAASVAAMNSRR